MKFEISSTEKFSRGLINFKIPLLPTSLDLRLTFYKTPNAYTWGYTSRCKDGKHVLFLDYDNIEQEDIETELEYFIKKHELPDFYLFSTPDRTTSFHAVCLGKFDLFQAFEIVKQTSCDQAFKTSPISFKGKSWVLRISEKGKRKAPEFLKLIKSPYNDKHEISKAHLLFLQKIFKVPKILYNRTDQINQAEFIKYNTANRV